MRMDPTSTAALSLVARCLPGHAVEGCEADRLLAAWAGAVLGWCRLLCDGRAVPEDAAQEVLLVLAEKAPAMADGDEVRRWLWGVTWRVVRRHQRRAWVRRWLPGTGMPGGAMEAAPAQAPSDDVREVKAVLDALPAEHRRLLWLAYAEGASRAELCTHLGLPPGTLNRRLSAARAAFDHEARARGLAPLEVDRA